MNFQLLAQADAQNSLEALGTGASWWQTLGGLVAVFGLLMLFLRLLKRMSRGQGGGDTSLLAVWHLGPKREIQILRLGDMAHYIYRHDGSMVVLKEEPLAEFERSHGGKESPTVPGRSLKELLAQRWPFQSVRPLG